MKNFIIAFFILCCSILSAQLELKGKVVNGTNGEPLSYVNMGVIGKNIGTVTRRNGTFSLGIPEVHYSDTMRISMIGYESIELEASQLYKLLQSKSTISLTPSSYELNEVVISSSKLKSKEVGNRKWRENVSAAFYADKLGKEMGIIIKVKQRRTLIKDVTFVLSKNDIRHRQI